MLLTCIPAIAEDEAPTGLQSLPAAETGVPYYTVIYECDSENDVEYSLQSGDELPAGLGVVSNVRETDGEKAHYTFYLAGTPVKQGTYQFGIIFPGIAQMPYMLIVSEPSIALDDAKVGEEYCAVIFCEQTMTEFYTASLTDGALPDGLELREEITSNESPYDVSYDYKYSIEGIPAKTGLYQFSVYIHSGDYSWQMHDTFNYSIFVADGNVTMLPECNVGEEAKIELCTAGRDANAELSEDFNVPAGMRLERHEDGETVQFTLEGAPEDCGTYPFALDVTENGETKTRFFKVYVNAKEKVLAQGYVGVAYDCTIKYELDCSAETDPVTEVSGLPAGLSAECRITHKIGMTQIYFAISGTPTDDGIFDIALTAKIGDECILETTEKLIVLSGYIKGSWEMTRKNGAQIQTIIFYSKQKIEKCRVLGNLPNGLKFSTGYQYGTWNGYLEGALPMQASEAGIYAFEIVLKLDGIDKPVIKECAVIVTGDGIPGLEFPIGDADMNGTVNTGDAALILRHSAGMITLTGNALLLADANGDGKINTGDAAAILRYAAGIQPLS